MAKKMIQTDDDKTPLTDEQIFKSIKSNLHPEDFINYKQLTTLTNLPYKKGKSKILQLEDLHRFMDYTYDKDLKKYIILNIYNEPEPKSSRKRRSDAIYTNYLESSIRYNLLYHLKETDEDGVLFTKKRWWYEVGITNELYRLFYNKPKRYELLEKDELPDHLDKINIDEFFYRTYQRFDIIFNRSLDRLRDEKLLTYDDNAYMLSTDPKNVWDQKLATPNQISKILTCEKQILTELGFKSQKQLFLHPDKLNSFYHKVAILEEEKYQFYNVFKGIFIIPEKTFLPKELEYSAEAFLEAKKKVNEIFRQNNDNHITNRSNRYKMHFYDGNIFNDDGALGMISYSSTENIKDGYHPVVKYFKENQFALSDYLLNIL